MFLNSSLQGPTGQILLAGKDLVPYSNKRWLDWAYPIMWVYYFFYADTTDWLTQQPNFLMWVHSGIYEAYWQPWDIVKVIISNHFSMYEVWSLLLSSVYAEHLSINPTKSSINKLCKFFLLVRLVNNSSWKKDKWQLYLHSLGYWGDTVGHISIGFFF